MLNHARTLLINRDTSHQVRKLFWEPVPQNYTAVPLSNGLLRVRRVLFGDEPDLTMLYYRSRQLLSLLQASVFASVLTRHDPRITYQWTAKDQISPEVYEPHVSGNTQPVYVVSRPESSGMPYGRMEYAFQVQADSVITVTAERPVPGSRIFPGNWTNALSDEIPLSATGYVFRMQQPEAPESFRINGIRRPSIELASLPGQLASVGEEALVDLFSAGRGEPWTSLQSAWLEASDFPDTLSAITAALILRTEERRTAKRALPW